ncbi:MAG: Fic family protein [Saprospiraceae bacterium]
MQIIFTAYIFSGGRSGMYKIVVGNWRNDASGPMQVISGPMGKQKVHFEAPKADRLPSEMQSFLEWFNSKTDTDLVIKAAVAHLWFITIHPFEDGNGRIARALTDMLLSQSDGNHQRFYSMSSQIREERKLYYSILEKTQKGDLDITSWFLWFLDCLFKALQNSSSLFDRVLIKAEFWQKH